MATDTAAVMVKDMAKDMVTVTVTVRVTDMGTAVTKATLVFPTRTCRTQRPITSLRTTHTPTRITGSIPSTVTRRK